MVSPYGILFAAHLVSTSYGDLCSKVCECLLRRGTLTLPQIVRFTELTKENVINCLRVLVHQNCVQAFAVQQEGVFGEVPRIVTQYMALFDNVIHKLRAPKFMQIILEELDKDCLGLFEGLLQHGRLSLNQMIDRSKEMSGSADVQIMQESFKKLLTSRYIERCPAPEPFVEIPGVDEDRPKKRGAKSEKIAEPTPEQLALAAATPMESLRFLVEMDVDNKVEDKPKKLMHIKKRKKDEEILDSNTRKEVLWRVNFEEFMRCQRHKACISYVKSRISDDAGIVLSAIIELSRCSVSCQNAEKAACLSINDIHNQMIKKDCGVGWDFERIRLSFDQLGCQSISTGMDESYSIDLKGIIEMAQNEEVESMVMKRHGKEAYRIFRLLSTSGRVFETDKISDNTFVEKKDALKILYKLWKDDYLHMEKIMTSAARQSQFLLWSVNKQPVLEHVLDEMYHAALNLKLRLAHELERGKEVRQLPKEKLFGELQNKYNLLVKVTVILESSLMDLDDAIMLFS